MNDPIYQEYIAMIRALITSYGPSGAIKALIMAFDYEAEDEDNDEAKRKYLMILSVALRKLFK